MSWRVIKHCLLCKIGLHTWTKWILLMFPRRPGLRGCSFKPGEPKEAGCILHEGLFSNRTVWHLHYCMARVGTFTLILYFLPGIAYFGLPFPPRSLNIYINTTKLCVQCSQLDWFTNIAGNNWWKWAFLFYWLLQSQLMWWEPLNNIRFGEKKIFSSFFLFCRKKIQSSFSAI